MSFVHNVIFTGPAGGGKNSAMAAIVGPHNEGPVTLDGHGSVHLHRVQNRERFESIRPDMPKGKNGFAMIMDNTRQDPLADLERYVLEFKDFTSNGAIVIGVSRMEMKPRPGLYSYHTKLVEMGLKVPVFEVDGRRPEDVKIMLRTVLAMLEPRGKR